MSIARRTDPRGFLLRAFEGLRGAVIPVAAIVLTRDGAGPLFALAVAALAVAGAAAFGVLAWSRLTYTVGEEHIRVQSGVLARQDRAVPFERVQDVAAKQSLLARWLGLVEITFETGAGKGEDLTLAYVSSEEADRLRALVRERAGTALRSDARATGHAATPGLPQDAGAAERTLFAMPARRVLTLGLFNFSLVVFAALAGFLQQFEDVLPFDPWDIEGWQARLAGPGEWLAGLGTLAKAIGVAVLLAMLLIAGVLTGVVRTALREWNFHLGRAGNTLRRRRGLFTITEAAVPLPRVQAAITATGLLRARWGWHELALVSLAADAGAAHHVVAPLARMGEVDALLAETRLARPAEDLHWHSMTAASVWLTTLRSLAVPLAAAGIVWPVQAIVEPPGIPGEPWLVFIPLVWGAWRAGRLALSLMRTGLALDGEHLFLRSGRLAPRVLACPREKLHSAALIDTPAARRLGYTTLSLGLAGSDLAMPGLPHAVARDLQTRLLADMRRRDWSTFA